MEIENKVIVVTGGSGGIGQALATNFIHENAKIVILAKRDRGGRNEAAQSSSRVVELK